jgi:hypothetical protein
VSPEKRDFLFYIKPVAMSGNKRYTSEVFGYLDWQHGSKSAGSCGLHPLGASFQLPDFIHHKTKKHRRCFDPQ